jgi:hypothetical protein
VARSGGATGARSPQRDFERDSQATLAATARRVNTAHIVWGCDTCCCAGREPTGSYQEEATWLLREPS